ncbi:MAG: protein-L-isoaspartate(D-aspartate) O-methyltransferase [Bacteroidia bacterium]|nr:protein-L-isoaspartate(D-aspartate) O-methyltransferase [Bacteroidia bacterium]
MEAPFLTGKRKHLIDTLRKAGISNEIVLDAMLRVKRHLFVNDSAFMEHAYDNKAFQIGCGQTISAPYTVAFQSMLLDIKRGEKILEIGTGSGYQTAVLIELGAKVFSIERQKELYDKTKPLLQKLNYKAMLYYGDGYKGLPLEAPFNKIIVTAGAPYIPNELISQLKPNGIMIIPVGDGAEQKMKLVHKSLTGITTTEVGDFKFVPMLKNRQF